LRPLLTRRAEELVELAAHLAEEFQERAGVHDRANSFPRENYDRMQEVGYSALTVPEELGGLGASLLEFLWAQERLAAGDGSTALAINMHLAPAGSMAERWRRSRDGRLEELLRGIAEGTVILAGATSEPGGSSGSLFDCRTAAEAVEGGYLLNGRKTFLTGAPVATHLTVNARYEGDHGPRIGFFEVPRAADGVVIEETWDVLGMRATQSHDLVLRDVFVPGEAFAYSYPANHLDARLAETVFAWNVPSFGSVFLGIGVGAMSWVTAFLRDRDRHRAPAIQHLFAEMEVLLETGRALLFRHALEVMESDFRSALSVQEAVTRGALAKYVATNNAVSIVDKAMDAVGGAGYQRRFPLERMYRDVRAGPMMPFNNLEAMRLFGLTHFGFAIAPVSRDSGTE
jgi:alkylation response protein AidB-like acyl-CoA dehydrogenase